MAFFTRPGRERADAAPEVRASEGRRSSSATRRSRFRRRRDEHWRFTDLRGLRPRGLHGERRRRVSSGASGMLDVDAAAIAACERGRDRDRARAGGRRVRAARERPQLLGTLVGADEKFAAHNAARVEARAARARPEGRRAREAALRPHRQLGGRRRALLAPARRRRGGQPLHASSRSTSPRRPSSPATRTRSTELFVEQGAKLEYVSIQNLSPRDVALRLAPRARRARRRARLGRGRLRLEEGQGPDRERPRRPGRDLACDRRLLRGRRPAPRLRHAAGAPRAEHDLRLRLQGRAPRPGDRGLARDDPRRARTRRRRTPTRRTATCSSPTRRTRTRSRASRSRPTTSAARTARPSARSTATSSSTAWPAGSPAARPSA